MRVLVIELRHSLHVGVWWDGDKGSPVMLPLHHTERVEMRREANFAL